MITKLFVKNFKSFGEKEQIIPLSNINLIFGENSSGKSSIIQTIYFLRNFFLNDSEIPSPVDIFQFPEFFNNHDFSKNIELGLEIDNKIQFKFEFKYQEFLEEFNILDNFKVIDLESNLKWYCKIIPVTHQDEYIKKVFGQFPDFRFTKKKIIEVSFSFENKNSQKKLLRYYSIHWNNIITNLLELIESADLKTDIVFNLGQYLEYIRFERKKRHEDSERINYDRDPLFNKFIYKFEELNPLKSQIEEFCYPFALAELLLEIDQEEGSILEYIVNLSIDFLFNNNLVFDNQFFQNGIPQLTNYYKRMIIDLKEIDLSKFLNSKFIYTFEKSPIAPEFRVGITSKDYTTGIVFYNDQLYLNSESSKYELNKEYSHFLKYRILNQNHEEEDDHYFQNSAYKRDYSKYMTDKLEYMSHLLSHDENNEQSRLLLCLSNFKTSLSTLNHIWPIRFIRNSYYIYKENINKDFGYLSADQLYLNTNDIIEKINETFKKLDINYYLFIEKGIQFNKRMFIIRLKDKNNDTDVNISEVGYGISQLLPVIIQLNNEARISTIEQPELHLHPSLQSRLAILYLDKIIENPTLQFLIETHSEHLLFKFQYFLRKKLLDQNNIKIVFVTKKSIILNLELDEKGKFLEGWPDGFFDSDLDSILG